MSKAGPKVIGGSVEQSVMSLMATAHGSGRKDASCMRRAFLYG
jgi:hypothetical protein